MDHAGQVDARQPAGFDVLVRSRHGGTVQRDECSPLSYGCHSVAKGADAGYGDDLQVSREREEVGGVETALIATVASDLGLDCTVSDDATRRNA